MRILIATTLLLASTTAFADNCRFTEPRNLDIDAGGIRLLALEFGSDDLNLEGVAGLERIEIRGRACGSSRDRTRACSVGANSRSRSTAAPCSTRGSIAISELPAESFCATDPPATC